jgi:hypothetical protein
VLEGWEFQRRFAWGKAVYSFFFFSFKACGLTNVSVPKGVRKLRKIDI